MYLQEESGKTNEKHRRRPRPLDSQSVQQTSQKINKENEEEEEKRREELPVKRETRQRTSRAAVGLLLLVLLSLGVLFFTIHQEARKFKHTDANRNAIH